MPTNRSNNILYKNSKKNHLIPLENNLYNRDGLILWYDDFEDGAEGWLVGEGWNITDDNSNSPSHSMVSPNGSLDGWYDLLTPSLTLPEIGVDETMHFGFSLYADMPDSDGDSDTYLDDYYRISILGFGESSWHYSDFNFDNGGNYWCADSSINGYGDEWLQFLDTPSIAIGENASISARIYFSIETPEPDPLGQFVEGSCTDGWDAANVRISKDNGISWELLEDSLNPYHFNCGYGWIYNDPEYEAGGSLNHLAKGWGGSSESWIDFSADLSQYANNDIIIRFAFGSDPAFSTVEDGSLTGYQIDAITVRDDLGILFSDNGINSSSLVVLGQNSSPQFYDYGSVDDGRPGSSGWEDYMPGLPFNGNTFLNISEFAGKTIRLKIQTKYDENHDGGQGEGLYIDDFMIYKLSTGAYFAPWGLEAEAGDGLVSLSWVDMNVSGTDDFIYDNGVFSSDNAISTVDADGWAGVLFDNIGLATINSFSIFNTQNDTSIDVNVYGMFGSTINTEPIYSKKIDIVHGWNEYLVDDWDVENYFVIAHQINPDFGVALDTSQTTLHSVLRLGGAWDFALDYNVVGDFGIRANVTYQGANVTYNVFRDDQKIGSDLNNNVFLDEGVVNNISYSYSISATYSDGEESGYSEIVMATPLASTIEEYSYNDNSFESEFIAGVGNFSAVKFSTNGLSRNIARFKWFQIGEGGAFYFKVFEDSDGLPGAEIFSKVLASGNDDGWNHIDLSSEGLNVSGEFWIGSKEFSSSKPFGLDISTAYGNSYAKIGDEGWTLVDGNIAYNIYLNSNLEIGVKKDLFPKTFGIKSILPNPFNPIARIHYEIIELSYIRLLVSDLKGNLISVLENGTMSPGSYQAAWEGLDDSGNQVSSGVYFISIELNNLLIQSRKVAFVK